MKTTMYVLAVLVSLLSLHPALAARVPKKAVVGQDVHEAPEPGQVTMEGFLGDRIEVNRIGRLGRHITEDMLLNNFRERRRSAPWIGEHAGKWIHAATLALENHPTDKQLAEKIRRIAGGLMDCQMEDGYLGTYTKQDRWGDYIKPNPTSGWDVWVHKYVMLGLLSYYRTTGDQRALETCRRVGDLLIATFGDEGGKRNIAENGTHAGMASISVLEPMSLLCEYTGEEKYRRFCEYLVREGDEGPKLLTNIEEKRTVQAVGNKKGYEMMSCYVGLVENWRASGYQRGLNAAELAWGESINKENVFITGAPDAHEYFGEPHDLDTSDICTETCAQVSWLQMNWQLLRATGKPRYAAMIHRHLYNHMLAAQHPDGVNWCYFTPMEGPRNTRSGFHGRVHCCGSSGPRAIALMAGTLHADDKKLVPLFNGKTFDGWEGDTEKTWSIEDGAIVAGSLEKEAPRNEFLATTKTFENFELRLKFKITGTHRGNAGVQFRARRIPDHHEVSGYQADIGSGVDGHLYDESRRRRMLATPEEQTLKKVGEATAKEIFARDDIDAVLVGTGDRWHTPLSILAAKAGKDVYCEKPFSLTIGEGRRLVDVTRRYGTIWQCGTQRRSNDSYRFVVELIKDGKIGRLHMITAVLGGWGGNGFAKPETPPDPEVFDYDRWLGQAPWVPYSSARVQFWRNRWDTGAGVIADMGAHYFDFAQWARGSYTNLPVEFEGTAVWPTGGLSEVPFSVDVTARYADGVRLLMTNGSKGVRFDGDKGWLHVTDDGRVTGEPKSILSSAPRVSWTVMSGHVRNFLDCMKSREPTRSNPEVAQRVHTICHCANIALRLGRKVKWNPTAEQFVDDGQANRMLSRSSRPPWRV